MNRVLRLMTSCLNGRALRLATSWFVTTPSSKRLSWQQSAVGWTACFVVLGCACWICYGVKLLPGLWLLAELIFLAMNLDRMHRFNQMRTKPESDTRLLSLNMDRLLKSLLKLRSFDHMDGWLMDNIQCKKFVALPKENLLDILSYTFGYQKRNGDASYDAALNSLVQKIENASGVEFPAGYDRTVRFREHLWEDIRMNHYPFIFYAALEALGMISDGIMGWLGYRREALSNGYYYVYGRVNASSQPVVFVHGIGIGLMMYLPFLRYLRRLHQPIIAVELRHLSLRPCFEAPSIDDVVAFVRKVLDKHDVKGATFIGHSFGTLIASRFNVLFPERVKGMCLMDPVCCVMHHPKLVSSFIYRDVQWRSLSHWIMNLTTYLISHDPSIAVSVCRNFKWTELNLWPENLTKKTMLVLSASDALVPVREVQSVFEDAEAEVIVHSTHSHGSFLVDAAFQEMIMGRIDRMLLD